MWIIDDVWLIIKSYLLMDDWKWKFGKVLNELPRAKTVKHLSTYRRTKNGFAIIKRFQKIGYFKNYERFIVNLYIDKIDNRIICPYDCDEFVGTDD